MATLKVEIVTPEAALWVGDATALMARSSEGNFTVLPEHTATVGDVVPSVVRVTTASGEISFVVHGGYFQVGQSEAEDETLATVLAGAAELVTNIDVARAQLAKEVAEAQLAVATKADQHDTPSYLIAHAALQRAELRLRAASK